MILYSLNCAAGHGFESWFRDSAGYEAQRGRGLVSCPVCGSVEVEKAIMAPALARSSASAPVAEPPSQPAPQPVALVSEREQALRAMLRAVREHVTRNSDYVGEDFATLARGMHEGEVEKRSIHGEASAEEVRALIEDEIEVHPLPTLPEDRN